MGYGNPEVFLSAGQREELIRAYLGKTVDVIIDRPIGFHHVTKGIHLNYTINYGYLPGVIGGDGEEQDVYVLGVKEPLERFTGRIIGAVRRADDNEDKLIAAPEGVVLRREDMAREIHFVEQYFDSSIQSLFDEKAGAPMRKIFLLSFDDGTIYDPRFVELLNRYQIPCTFNLNSGLEDFVWDYEDRVPIRRQRLAETVEIYRGHEIASHSLHHHWLNTLTPPQLAREIGEDCTALKGIFGVEDIGFAVPFTACSEREIRIIRKYVRYIRLSEMSGSFALPEDPYHIPIHRLYNEPDIREKITRFAENDLPVSLFVLAGHSYEFEVLDHWTYIEELLEYIRSFDFEIMTTMEFVNDCYPQK